VDAQKSFISITEAAERKGVHYQTVRRAIRRGNLSATKIGGGVLIAITDLDGWQPKYDHAPRIHKSSQIQDTAVADGLTLQGAEPGWGRHADRD